MTRFLSIMIIALLGCFQAAAQEQMVFESAHLKCNDTVLVFTPQQLQKGAPCPTLFLLHGWSGCYRDWSRKYDIQEISDRTGFRIITPDGFYSSWYLNSTDPAKMQWRDFFWKELFPEMERKYRLDPQTTFITGLSMGGHGAVNLFIDHPEKFRSAGSMSGVLDLQYTPLAEKWIMPILGDEPSRLACESAVNRIQKIKDLHKPVIVTCGYDDFYCKCADNFSRKCRDMGIEHVLILSPGTHSWPYWGFALENHLRFFRQLLNGENLGYQAASKK